MVDIAVPLRRQQIEALLRGKCSRISLAADHPHRFKTLPPEERKPATRLPLPMPWRQIAVGDRLWVQEEVCVVWDKYNRALCTAYYRADLLGGVAPIPDMHGGRAGRWMRKNYEAKKMQRDGSRFVLTVTAVRIHPVQELTWDEVKAEAFFLYGTDSLNQWWDRWYGFLLPWRDNPTIVGVEFTAEYANIDGLPLPPRKAEKAAANLRAGLPAGDGDGGVAKG